MIEAKIITLSDVLNICREHVNYSMKGRELTADKSDLRAKETLRVKEYTHTYVGKIGET